MKVRTYHVDISISTLTVGKVLQALYKDAYPAYLKEEFFILSAYGSIQWLRFVSAMRIGALSV